MENKFIRENFNGLTEEVYNLQRLENGYQLLLLEYFYLDLYLWLYSNKLQFSN